MGGAGFVRSFAASFASWVALSLVSSPELPAQVTIGADLVSRYVWRGTDFGESVSLQPHLAYSGGGLAIGTWASYSISASGSDANEHDIYLSYSLGSVSFGATDYHFPNNGAGFFDFADGGDGAHWIEPYVTYHGPESLPVTVYFGVFVYNDPANSTYLEVGYPLYSDGVELGFATGVTLSGSKAEPSVYGTTGPGLINVSFGASRNLTISDSFALPIAVRYALNPYAGRSFLVLGISAEF